MYTQHTQIFFHRPSHIKTINYWDCTFYLVEYKIKHNYCDAYETQLVIIVLNFRKGAYSVIQVLWYVNRNNWGIIVQIDLAWCQYIGTLHGLSDDVALMFEVFDVLCSTLTTLRKRCIRTAWPPYQLHDKSPRFNPWVISCHATRPRAMSLKLSSPEVLVLERVICFERVKFFDVDQFNCVSRVHDS